MWPLAARLAIVTKTDASPRRPGMAPDRPLACGARCRTGGSRVGRPPKSLVLQSRTLADHAKSTGDVECDQNHTRFCYASAMALQGQERDLRRLLLTKVNQTYAQYIHEYLYQKFLYRYLTRKLSAEDVVFLNYGYEEDPPMGVSLSPSDEPNRFLIQLYHRTAMQADLQGKRVLEVGCGHGGGASYLMRTFHPASYTGLDLNSAGIDFCRRRHDVAGLEFVQGDAEDLPFPDQSFDVVINIESSHLYGQFPRFLTEVARVLVPGGHFLYADFRLTEGLATWEAQLADAPMRMLSQRVISSEVMRGMEKNSQWWTAVVNAVVPALARRFAVNRGQRFVRKTYEGFQSGGPTEYRMYSFARE